MITLPNTMERKPKTAYNVVIYGEVSELNLWASTSSFNLRNEINRLEREFNTELVRIRSNGAKGHFTKYRLRNAAQCQLFIDYYQAKAKLKNYPPLTTEQIQQALSRYQGDFNPFAVMDGEKVVSKYSNSTLFSSED